MNEFIDILAMRAMHLTNPLPSTNLDLSKEVAIAAAATTTTVYTYV